MHEPVHKALVSSACFLCLNALPSTPRGKQISSVYRSGATWTKNRTQSFFFLSNSKKYIVVSLTRPVRGCFASTENSTNIDILNRIMPKGQFPQTVLTEGWSWKLVKYQLPAQASCLLNIHFNQKWAGKLPDTSTHPRLISAAVLTSLPKGKDVLWNFNFFLWVLSLTMHFWIKSDHSQLIFWISKICYDRY